MARRTTTAPAQHSEPRRARDVIIGEGVAFKWGVMVALLGLTAVTVGFGTTLRNTVETTAEKVDASRDQFTKEIAEMKRDTTTTFAALRLESSQADAAIKAETMKAIADLKAEKDRENAELKAANQKTADAITRILEIVIELRTKIDGWKPDREAARR